MPKFSREGSSSRKPTQGGKPFKKSGPSSTGKSFKSSGTTGGSRFKRTEGEGSGASSRPYKSRSTGGFDGDSKPRFSRDNEGGDRPKRSFKPRSEDGGFDSKPRFKRTDGEGSGASSRPYKSRSTGSLGGESKPRFSRDNEGGDRPKRSFKPRSEGGGFDSKPRFKRTDGEGPGASSRPYKSRSTGSLGGESKPRFSRDNEGGDRPKRSFKAKSEDGGFDSKPRFKKSSSDEFGSSARPYKSRSTGSFGGESKPRFSRDNEGGDRPKRSFKAKSEDGGFDSKPRFKKSSSDDSDLSVRPYKPKPTGGFDGDSKPRFRKDNEGGKKQGKDFKPRTISKSEEPKTEREGIRLNRYIANAGICSRREADQLILEGHIKINGKIVTEMGVMVQSGDAVKYGGRLLNPEKSVYVLLNKPKDFITTTNDPQERNTVMNLVANACRERIYPVGRLDRNTTGLLLFTNDGELVEKLTHPSHKVKKIYQVELNRPISPEDAEAILDGLYFEEGKAVVDSMAVLDATRRIIGIEIHIGWNRIVRRVFEAKGYDVVKLDRVSYAGLTKKDLPRGHYRILTEKEVIMLKHFV